MTLQHEARQDALKLALQNIKNLDIVDVDPKQWLDAVGYMADCFLAYAETPGHTTVGFHHINS